jgi:polysaccharide deacetylase family protein (PEP-CTERM system associated)
MRSSASPASANGVLLNAMTIDVEDYFHVSALAAAAPRDRWASFEPRVVSNTERLLDLFARHHVTATFFCLGWVAERYPGLIRRIADAGHEVASHGFWHQLVYDITPEAFREDVRRSRALLESLVGRPVVGYRAPSYSITRRSLWALDVLVEEGYEYDASIFPIRHDRYGIPDAPRHAHVLAQSSGGLIELPPSTVRVLGTNLPVAGGGYFRLLPFWWTRWGIARVNAHEQRPVIFYLHPWEIDPDQPRLPAPLLSRVRHYRNLHLTERRLTRLMELFTFAPLRDVMAHWPELVGHAGSPLPTEAPPDAGLPSGEGRLH